MERMLADFERAHGIKWMSLRYFNAAGCSPDGDIGELHDPESHLIPLVIMAALGRREAIGIFGDDYSTRDGTCERDYIHVDDLARAHVLGITHLLAGGSSAALNLGTGSGSTVKEIINGVEEISGRKIPAKVLPRRSGDPARLIADASLANQALGWKAEKSLKTMLENAYKFHASH